MFELAEIHESMMDAKLDGGGEKGGVSYAKVYFHYFLGDIESCKKIAGQRRGGPRRALL